MGGSDSKSESPKHISYTPSSKKEDGRFSQIFQKEYLI